ncbi:MAG: type II toxin-antitoxin system RelE/ParE family toxin [Terracidiphilus sp.]
MRIRLAPQARTDLDEIWLYVARKSGNTETATRHIESIARGFGLLVKFPLIGRSLEARKNPNVRTLTVRKYIVFYRPADGEIRILRIIHAARDAYAVFAGER